MKRYENKMLKCKLMLKTAHTLKYIGICSKRENEPKQQ